MQINRQRNCKQTDKKPKDRRRTDRQKQTNRQTETNRQTDMFKHSVLGIIVCNIIKVKPKQNNQALFCDILFVFSYFRLTQTFP